MAETGWPLIPRELLPAPVQAAAPRPRRISPSPDGIRQLSIFGAETTDISPADLAGLLVGPGQLGRMGGTARVSVPVDAAWRVHVLVSELVARGLVVSWVPLGAENHDHILEAGVREEPPHDRESVPESGSDPQADVVDPQAAARLARLAKPTARPARGAATPAADSLDDFPSAEITDDAPGLGGGDLPSSSSDATAADLPSAPARDETPGGEPAVDGDARDADGDFPAEWPTPLYEVRTAFSSRLAGLARAWPPPADKLFLSGPRLRLWVAAAGRPLNGGYVLGLGPVDNVELADSALVRAGLAGKVSDHGREYAISGRKRLRRLAELVGERPAAAPAELWPGGAAA